MYLPAVVREDRQPLVSLGGCPLREVQNVLELYIGRIYFGTSSCVLCREVVSIEECPLLEVPLYLVPMSSPFYRPVTPQ